MNKTLESLDLTDFDLSWYDPYSLIKIGGKICLSFSICITWLIGVFLHIGFYSFERYGGDPQKRGLPSQVHNYVTSGFTVFLITVIFFSSTPIALATFCSPTQSHFRWIFGGSIPDRFMRVSVGFGFLLATDFFSWFSSACRNSFYTATFPLSF